MRSTTRLVAGFGVLLTGFALGTLASGLVGQTGQPKTAPPHDAITDAQTPRPVPEQRPEQRKTAHDRSDIFKAPKAMPTSHVFDQQPERGDIAGFDFYPDPLNAKRPGQTAEEIMQEDITIKPRVMEAQRKLLESRYNLTPKHDPSVTMSRGKPICVGPTAR